MRVAFAVAVADPFSHIARSVVNAKVVGGKAAYGSGFTAKQTGEFTVTTSATIGATGGAVRLISPPISAIFSGPGNIFPLGLSRQAVIFPGLFAQPAGVHGGFFPTDINNGSILSTPAIIAR